VNLTDSSKVGFEQAGAHSFRRYRNTYLRKFTARPESILDFWLGWTSKGMSAHYDTTKSDVALHKEVANSCGGGFNSEVCPERRASYDRRTNTSDRVQSALEGGRQS